MEEQRIANIALLKVIGNVIVALLSKKKLFFNSFIFFASPLNKGLGMIYNFN